MIFRGKIQQVLWLWGTGALIPVAAQQPQAPSIPIEVPQRSNPGVPEHVLQMQEMLQNMTPQNGEPPRKLQPTPPEEAPKRGIPGMPPQGADKQPDSTRRALPREIPVRRSPGMPEEMVYHRSPIYFPWQTGYIMPKHTPLPESPEEVEPTTPPDDTTVPAPAPAEHKQESVDTPPPTPVSHIAEAQPNAVPQQSEPAQAVNADTMADRLRFERYLQQPAEKSGETHATMEKLLVLTAEGSKGGVVAEVRHLLVSLKDDDAAISLINAIDSVRDARRANDARHEENKHIRQQIDELTATNNSLQNRNSARQKKATGQRGNSNVVLMAHNNHTISRLRAKIQENEALITSTTADARSSYEAYVAQLLAQGFYDHATIGARLNRHLFREEGIGTGENLAARALQHRESVDKRMQAVNAMLQENKLVGANEALEHAFREGEHMFSIREFPTAARRRIADFRSQQKRLESAMKAKDYNAAEQTIARLSAMSSDCEVAKELAQCAQKKAESDMYLREGAKALKRRDEATYTATWQKAAEIWPMNPNLDTSLELAEKLDGTNPLYDEFRLLMNRKAYREIYNDRQKFGDVCAHDELAIQYRDVLHIMTTLDEALRRIETAVAQSPESGACMAVETLTLLAQQDKRYTDDRVYSEALYRHTFAAAKFCRELKRAASHEQNHEYGAALTCYYRALKIYPQSELAATKIREIAQFIMSADFDLE